MFRGAAFNPLFSRGALRDGVRDSQQAKREPSVERKEYLERSRWRFSDCAVAIATAVSYAGTSLPLMHLCAQSL